MYLYEFKTLTVGDALFLQNGELVISSQASFDMELAKKSIKRLLDYDIEKLSVIKANFLTVPKSHVGKFRIVDYFNNVTKGIFISLKPKKEVFVYYL